MEYNGAATQTEIRTPAETWQIDFTARLSGVDERQRVENVDVYGQAAFLGMAGCSCALALIMSLPLASGMLPGCAWCFLRTGSLRP
jgi:hypothetical protein